jgi:hypothetical protein
MSNRSRPTTLHLFGAGGSFSRRYRTSCSMLTLPSGRRWLIDCGRPAPDQLYAAGFVWHDIAGQIVTHVDGDHAYGLEDFAFIRYFESRGTDLAGMFGGTIPRLVAHSAVRAEIWQMLSPSLRYISDGRGDPRVGTLAHFFEIVTATTCEPPRHDAWPHAEHFVTDDLHLVTRETLHVPGKPSCSLEIRVDDDPRSERIAWWSGDGTVDTPMLVALEPRTSIFFHGGAFIAHPGQVHGPFETLTALPERVRHKMVLLHHGDDLDQHRERVEAAGFRVATPGQVYDLTSGRRLR